MAIKSGYETFKGPKGPIKKQNIVFSFARTYMYSEISKIRAPRTARFNLTARINWWSYRDEILGLDQDLRFFCSWIPDTPCIMVHDSWIGRPSKELFVKNGPM